MDAASLKASIAAITTAISGTKDADAIAKLTELRDGPAPSEQVLRESKGGGSISKLKKNKNKEISSLSDQIIAKWKSAVDIEKKRKRGPEDENGNDEKRVKVEDKKVSKKEADVGSPAPEQKKRKYSTIADTGRKDRSAATDKPSGLAPLEADDVSDKERTLRDKGVTMCYDALAFDNMADKSILVERAVNMELALYIKSERQTGDAYRTSIRELYLNLREANPALRDSVVKGDGKTPTEVVNMSREEFASEAIKAETAAIEKMNLFNAQGAGETEAETFAFKCGKCGQNKTRYYQMQTRSADEPMTTFVTCINCNNKWKFS